MGHKATEDVLVCIFEHQYTGPNLPNRFEKPAYATAMGIVGKGQLPISVF